MPTNREVLAKTDLAELLITIEDGMQRSCRCVINVLNESSNATYNVYRKCGKNCADCIKAWLDEQALILPSRGGKAK